MASDILSPVGRLVQGHPLVAKDKNMQGAPLTFRNGEPRSNFFFAIAVKKSNKKFDVMMESVKNEAESGFPILRGKLQFPSEKFSWKIVDGDLPEHEDKQGFAGCWIMKFSNSFVSEVVDLQTRQGIISQDQLKCGDYVQVFFRCKANGNKEKPGVYLNQLSVGKVMDGEEIVNKTSYINVFDTSVSE
jgi:hypothetical protein